MTPEALECRGVNVTAMKVAVGNAVVGELVKEVSYFDSLSPLLFLYPPFIFGDFSYSYF